MESKDRFLDAMLREEMRRLNAHLPKQRLPLSDLLLEELPAVPTVDGGKIMMKKPELEELAASVPPELRSRVRLPLVLIRRSELGTGAFTLLGDAAEEYVLSKIAKSYAGSLDEFKRTRGKESVFYRPQVSDLMRRFHSLVVLGFGVPETRND